MDCELFSNFLKECLQVKIWIVSSVQIHCFFKFNCLCLILELQNCYLYNFEHFINYVDFNLLTDKNIFEFSRIVPTDKLDMFINAYEKYKRS